MLIFFMLLLSLAGCDDWPGRPLSALFVKPELRLHSQPKGIVRRRGACPVTIRAAGQFNLSWEQPSAPTIKPALSGENSAKIFPPADPVILILASSSNG